MTAPTKGRTYTLGPVLPHVRRAAELVGNRFGVTTIHGWRATARDMTGHPAGRALDFMCGRAQGDQITAYLQANHGALGLDYLIWEQRSWDPDTGWDPMEDRGSPTQNHFDHVHAQFKVLHSGSVDEGGVTKGGVTKGGARTLADDGWDAGILAWLPGYQPGELGDGDPLEALGPSAWLTGAAGVGLKLLVTGCAVALVVAGAVRTVSPGGSS